MVDYSYVLFEYGGIATSQDAHHLCDLVYHVSARVY